MEILLSEDIVVRVDQIPRQVFKMFISSQGRAEKSETWSDGCPAGSVINFLYEEHHCKIYLQQVAGQTVQ